MHIIQFHATLYLFIIELKNGRIPEGIDHRMVYWKAEDYRKFTYPASECVLGVLPEQHYHAWFTLLNLSSALAEMDGMPQPYNYCESLFGGTMLLLKR